MEADIHPDPFRDAAGHGLQRAMQVVSCAVTAAQVVAYQRKTQARAVAERDDRTRRALHAQARAEKDAARADWAAALDPDWIRHASLLDAAQAWGAAAPYADRDVPWYEPSAATALRKTEERLRELHPYAMARYDRLRADGASSVDGMRQAAPLFAREPRARDAGSVPRQALDAGARAHPADAADNPAPGAGGPPGDLGPSTLDLRDREAVSQAGRSGRTDAEAAAVVGVTPRARRSGRPWERDFPVPIREVVAAAVSSPGGGQQAVAANRYAARRPVSGGQVLRP